MSTETRYLTAAETSKLIRKALKASFPRIKFSVRSSNYAGGSSISIHWIDGPTTKQVKVVTDRFQGSDFDGMQDLKTSRGPIEVDGERVKILADFVFTERHYSPNAYAAAARAIGDYWGIDAPEVTISDSYRFKGKKVANGFTDNNFSIGGEYLTTLIYRELQDQAATERA